MKRGMNNGIARRENSRLALPLLDENIESTLFKLLIFKRKLASSLILNDCQSRDINFGLRSHDCGQPWDK
jgi:hypothetical protein